MITRRLWLMLKQRATKGVPLFGSFGFPYNCGVTESEFEAWARSPIQETYRDQSITAGTVGGVLANFCDDCAMRKYARAEGTCIKPILDEFMSHTHVEPQTVGLTVMQARERLAGSRRVPTPVVRGTKITG